MKVSRRDFLKWCSASAVAMGLSKFDLQKLEDVVFAAEGMPPVIWLQGSGCSGCTISLLNSVETTTIDDILLNKIDMQYHQSIMTSASHLATSELTDTAIQYAGQFILIVEGAVPVADNGMNCVIGEKNDAPWTMYDAVRELAAKAKYVIAAGTCASFGGVAKGGSNPTGITQLNTVLNGLTMNEVINLPGCPVHPYTLTKTLIDLLLYGMPTLDSMDRPTEYYRNKIHGKCPNRGGNMVNELGVVGCYKRIGCNGPSSVNNCPTMPWNNGTNWCIQANHICIGCATPSFGTVDIYD